MKATLVLVAAIFLISCNEQRQREVKTLVAAEPAESRSDTLLVEGQPEVVNLQLYAPPPAWPLQFYTYLPPMVETEMISAGEGDALKFSFNEASLTFFTLPEGTNRSVAQELAIAALGSPGVQACENEWAAWQWGCYYASDQPQRVRQVFIGEEQGRLFYFLLSYPAEYGDGFSPRYKMLLDHWTWRS